MLTDYNGFSGNLWLWSHHFLYGLLGLHLSNSLVSVICIFNFGYSPCRCKMCMISLMIHVDSTGHTFITICSSPLFSCKLPWLASLVWSLSRELQFPPFYSYSWLYCSMSIAKFDLCRHFVIARSRYFTLMVIVMSSS